MIITHIETIDDKVILPLEEWNKILDKLKKNEDVEIEKVEKIKTWKRKLNKIKINGKSLSDTVIEERNENIF